MKEQKLFLNKFIFLFYLISVTFSISCGKDEFKDTLLNECKDATLNVKNTNNYEIIFEISTKSVTIPPGESREVNVQVWIDYDWTWHTRWYNDIDVIWDEGNIHIECGDYKTLNI
jgi:hypothetical protein